MAKRKRNIGQEVLDGIRQITRGEHCRITNVPSVSRTLCLENSMTSGKVFLDCARMGPCTNWIFPCSSTTRKTRRPPNTSTTIST